MDIVKGSGGRYIIGPLSSYNCDGISIERINLRNRPVYGIRAYEAEGRAFNSSDISEYSDFNLENGKGKFTAVYLTDEEMEALVLAWQVLKQEAKK
jgi:hypothetical protein